MRTIWTFHSAGKVVFGSGAVRLAGQEILELRCRRILIVTDSQIAETGALARLQSSLRESNLTSETFTGGQAEPSLELTEESTEHARRFQADCIIGLGGGSNMDLAKMTATLLKHGGDPRDYLGDCVVPGAITPLICMPTTAGTGSEVSASAVLTDTQNAMKAGVLSNYLRPAVAVVDPELTATCPAHVIADSGIDALTHAIEAFTAVDNENFPLSQNEKTVYQGRNPIGECFAERAISLVGQNLVRAFTDPDDMAAREGMAAAALLAGLAFSNIGVALVHAMEYPLGAAVHCSHGRGNGLLLPYVMRFNLPERAIEFIRIAQLLGHVTSGMADHTAAELAISSVENIQLAVGIPRKLTELGVTREMLPGFAEKAFGVKRVLRVNPRAVTQEDVLQIYESAL